jgi:superfamily II DNA or RNA helicase
MAQVNLPSDLAIRLTVGARAQTAGRSNANEGRVGALTIDAGRPLLSATVQGAQLSPYHVVVVRDDEEWAGHCTCPVSINCKHVAAVMYAARQPSTRSMGSVRSWEDPIAALVRRPAPLVASGAPLALQLEVVPAFSGRYAGAQSVGPRVRLRPVTLGRTGNWVRTGVSWRDLQYEYGRTDTRPEHREVMRAIIAAWSATTGSYYGYGYGSDAIHLDELGPSLWRLLDDARTAGLELVMGKTSGAAVAVLEAAEVVLDLRRDPSGQVVLAPVVRSGGRTVAGDQVHLLGERPHGLFTDHAEAIAGLLPAIGDTSAGPARLLLAPLEPRPDERIKDLLGDREEIHIPEEELERFFTSYFPALRQVVAITCGDGSLELPEITPPELAVTATFGPDHQVELDWGFAYRSAEDVQRVPLTAGREPELGVYRDPAAERELLEALDPGLRRLLGRERLTGMDSVSFTEQSLPALTASPDVELTVVGETPQFRAAESAPLIQLSATDVDENPDWFDLGVTVSVDGEEIPFGPLFVALAAGESHLLLPSGLYFSLDRPELESLRRLIEEARDLQEHTSDGLRLSVYQAGLWEELLDLGVVETQSARWTGAVRGLLNLQELPSPPVPDGFDADLRPYQRDGFEWLAFLWAHRLGGILADDMGLGKTIQTLAMICHAREAAEPAAPFLVVAPTSVVGNWERVAERFAPGLKVWAVTETTARRGTPLREDVAGADLVITSYALFRIDFDSYDSLEWGGLVLDEAQVVKNHQAKGYQCARRLSAPFKLAMTGTPLENSLMDLWSLLSIVAPGLYPNPGRFSEDYRRPIERGENPELLGRLRRRIRPLMLRRTKEQVVAELPPKQEQVLDVALNPKHQKIYNTHLQRERQKVLGLLDDLDRNRFVIFRSLTLLRQLSLDPALVDPAYATVRSSKADAFLEKLREVVGEGHRALVFSQFTGFLRTVRDELDAAQIPYCYLDGRTRKRAERIEEFKQGDVPVFLISLKAGGVGLNLTEADYCFILDPWWNPAVEAQAVDRTHRIGQDKTVMVYRLVATGTIEEKVMELKARKQALFSRVMDDDALLSAPLSVEDIQGLFT